MRPDVPGHTAARRAGTATAMTAGTVTHVPTAVAVVVASEVRMGPPV
ncbi:hypothetical protein ABZT47_17435 [Sphaerisporangium sp. NPDC005289]